MSLPFGDAVTVFRRPPKNRHGDAAGADVPHTIVGCGIDWNATSSNNQFQDVETTDVDLYVPRAGDVIASDRVELPDGSRFTVLGRPMWDQVHPMTGTDFGYKLVRLREVSGA